MDKPAVPFQHFRMATLVKLTPVELRALEGLHLLGVGIFVGAPSKGGELAAAPLRDGLRHLRIIVIGEVLEWSGGGELFTLEDHGDKRRSEYDAGCRRCTIHANDVLETIACHPVAYLIVVLDVAKETVRGESLHRTPVAVAPVARVGSVVYEDTTQRLGQLF